MDEYTYTNPNDGSAGRIRNYYYHRHNHHTQSNDWIIVGDK